MRNTYAVAGMANGYQKRLPDVFAGSPQIVTARVVQSPVCSLSYSQVLTFYLT